MRIKLLVFIASALLALSTSARELPPEGGEPRDYVLPASTTTSLDNGVQVTLVPFGNIPKVTIVATVKAGNLHEGEQVWLADLVGQMLTEGAGDLDSDGLAAAAADMGAEIGVGVGVQQTQAALDVLSEFGPDAVGLLSDVLRRPKLPASEFERVRSNLLKNLAVARTQPQTQADEAFRQAIFGDHPYGVGLPNEADFETLTIEDVKRFHAQKYGSRGAHIYVAGQFDSDSILQAIRAAFSDWQPQPAANFTPPAGKPAPGTKFIDRPDAPQSTVYLGLPVVDPSHPDYIALDLTNRLLGGSFSSRITSNIREDKGYTYSPRSSVTVNQDSGYWVQTADITTEHTGAAIFEILSEIERMQDEAPPKDELDAMKNYRTGTFVLGNATRGGLIGQLQFLHTHNLPPEYLTQFVQKLNAVTPQTVQDITRKYLRPIDMTLVVVGDPETVPAQLKERDWVLEP